MALTPFEKELLVRVAPAYISATAIGVYCFIQIRNLNRQRKQSAAEHEVRLADMKVAAEERIKHFNVWRAAQPTVEEVLEKAKKEVGTVTDIRRKMNDPEHIWNL